MGILQEGLVWWAECVGGKVSYCRSVLVGKICYCRSVLVGRSLTVEICWWKGFILCVVECLLLYERFGGKVSYCRCVLERFHTVGVCC